MGGYQFFKRSTLKSKRNECNALLTLGLPRWWKDEYWPITGCRRGHLVGVFGLGLLVRDTVLGNSIIYLVERMAAGLTFAVLGFVSLVVADHASQWL